MKYALIALDVDGTLVGPDSALPRETARAVRDVRAAGLRVCLATGRSYAETIGIWRQLRLDAPYEPLVLIGGAMVSRPDTGDTLRSRAMGRDLAYRFADALAGHGLSAMAIVDGRRCDVDYYLAESGDVHAAQREWFSKMDVRLRRVPRLADARDMPDPLRISAVAAEDRAGRVAQELKVAFDGLLEVRAILAPNYGVTIVEAFAAGVDKFAAVAGVARDYGIAASGIVAVGDDINDLGMIRGAGLGVAVSHAAEPLRAAADVVAAEPLPALLRRIAAGELG